MRLKRAKFLLLSVFILLSFFLSNDLELINVEKTSIITAIAMDKEKDDYLITAQIAVPEATDTNTENQKAQLSGKGKTVGEAIKDLGNTSGWFPKLAFCNLIILGNELASENVVKVLDYFAKTLRVQDSALVVLAEKSGKEILSLSTPLDNISSFAVQKILLKTIGFDADVAHNDIKTFCTGYYSLNSSSFLPIIKVISADSGSGDKGESADNSTSSGSSSSSQGDKAKGSNSDSNNLFDVRTTALFKNGKKVGELNEELTHTFNAFNTSLTGTSLSIPEVPLNDSLANYFITVFRENHSFKVKATDSQVNLYFNLSLYCKVTDVNIPGTDDALSTNYPLPQPLVEKTQKMLTGNIEKIVEKSIETDCDFLKIKEKLYRHNNSKYSLFKDNFLSKLNVKINVVVKGPR